LDLYSKPTEVDGFCEKVLKSWMAFGLLDEKKGSSSFLVAISAGISDNLLPLGIGFFSHSPGA